MGLRLEPRGRQHRHSQVLNRSTDQHRSINSSSSKSEAGNQDAKPCRVILRATTVAAAAAAAAVVAAVMMHGKVKLAALC